MKDVNVLLNYGVNIDESLEIFGDMNTYDETLKIFLDEINNKISSLENFKEIGDLANYAIIVHGLKSEYRYLGFEEEADLCYKHEIESKANNLYFVSDDFDNLIDKINNTIVVAKKYFGQNVEEIKPVKNKQKDKKVLVVDDSSVIVNFINNIVDDEYEVITASDGQQALDIINENSNISAMLLDINMPNVDGFAVLNYLEEHNLFDKVSVSIITGISNEDLITQVFEYPIVDVLRKPFNERDLKIVLDETIGC